MRVMYIAFDDETFSSEEECLAYEKRLKNGRRFANVQQNVILYSGTGEELAYDNEDDFMQAYDQTAYVFVKNDVPDEALEFIEERGYGPCPTNHGFYYYGDYEWKSFTDLIAPVYDDLKENNFI